MGGGASKPGDMSWITLGHQYRILQIQKEAEIKQLREENNLKMRQLELEAENKDHQDYHEHQQKVKAIESEIRKLEIDHEQKLKEYDIEMEKLKEEFKLRLEQLGLEGKKLQLTFETEMARIEKEREEEKVRAQLMEKLIDQNLSTADFFVKALFATGAAIDEKKLGKASKMLQLLQTPAIPQGEKSEAKSIENTTQSETDSEDNEEGTSDMQNHAVEATGNLDDFQV